MLLVGLSILLDSSLGFLRARLVLGSPLGTVLPALVLIIGADVCLQIANSRISLTIAKILDVQSENHFLVRRQKMIKHMQNNGQALADLQKTPKPVSQNRDSKTVRGAKRLWKKFKRDLFVRLGRNLENI